MNSSTSSPVVAVLGMHRSGTSWLAGSLQEKGLELGEVSEANPHNAKGNRENKVLMDLHEEVLRANEGSWKRPRFPNRWTDEQRARLAEFVTQMDESYPRWGFKDPRSLFLLDEWRRRLGGRLLRIGIFRHPLAVHRSLHKRNERFTVRRSLRVWKAYNERLVAEHEREPFPMIRFDVDPETLQSSLDAACGTIELAGDERPAGFFDASLVHNDAAEERVPWRCRGLWSRLLATTRGA